MAGTTAKKNTVASEEKETIQEAIKEENKDVATVKKATKKKAKQFEDDDRIACLSVFPGSVGMTGKRTKTPYYWEAIDTIEYVEYQDLRAEVLNKKSSYIYKPLILVLDEDFIAQQPNLKTVYSKYYTPKQIIEKISSMNSMQLRKFINSLPSGIKDNVKTIAVDMIKDGSLDSIKKIRVIDEIFGTDLNLYSTYFE